MGVSQLVPIRRIRLHTRAPASVTLNASRRVGWDPSYFARLNLWGAP
jgi:hypothetical protein